MHRFTELINRGTAFTLSALNELYSRTVDALQTSAATSHVKNLQMVELQKTILAIGMFSVFEAMLQDGLDGTNGFEEAGRVLDEAGQRVLREEFSDYQKAINVLKHGRGRSYDALVEKADTLPFKIKRPTESFFFEGDVSEIATLIQVDDRFVQNCARIIQEVSKVITSLRPNYVL